MLSSKAAVVAVEVEVEEERVEVGEAAVEVEAGHPAGHILGDEVTVYWGLVQTLVIALLLTKVRHSLRTAGFPISVGGIHKVPKYSPCHGGLRGLDQSELIQ